MIVSVIVTSMIHSVPLVVLHGEKAVEPRSGTAGTRSPRGHLKHPFNIFARLA